ncbi:HD domain-containing protein [Brachybacterium sp. AOP43-C2-M15]|uniref:HD domain-containing protein n=1 Tax=Brachybacterium sp. AOP43-C2-M15 TaxID=3457661 RepID=UPI0040347B06
MHTADAADAFPAGSLPAASFHADTLSADTLGLDGVWSDPVWRLRTRLTPLERELLETWWVRRLAHVSHAGAASLTTTQGYSRLEHSLGTLALVAHFRPQDHEARAAALLHDVGHLPYSHTLEGIAGLDHHTIGRTRVHELAPVLERHGITAERVVALDTGEVPSPLSPAPGLMKLDHLDSFVRSGQAHGRTVIPPWRILADCRLLDGAVHTTASTAAELVRLVVAEARAQRSAPDIVPVAVLRSLVVDALADPAADISPSRLAALTDDELWSVLLRAPTTRDRAELLRRVPGAWRLVEPGTAAGDADDEVLDHAIARGYLSLPGVDGEPITDDRVEALEEALPLRCRIVRSYPL